MTTKPTKLIVKAGNDPKAARAARFGLINPSTGGSPQLAATNPADAEKLAARAARFADVLNASPSATLTTSAGTRVVNIADAAKLEARKARFADVTGNKGTGITSTTTATSPELKAQLAARAAKFADVKMEK